MAESQAISVEGLQELLSPMPRPIIDGRPEPDWVTVTHTPDSPDDCDRGYDLAQALTQPTEDVPPYMVKDLLFSLPLLPRYTYVAANVRDALDVTAWQPVGDQLQEAHDISTAQLRRATQRVQATAISDYPDIWPESYTDLGINEQHHGVTFDDLDGEFDMVETAIRVYAESVDDDGVVGAIRSPELSHHVFSTSVQLLQGEISWADFLSSRMMTDSMTIDELRNG
jgi:hypothetical protein